ncbi:MAG: ABC transporter permease subunit [Spirochaetales bacterium]|nr:ABC transporter permease subunit [Spirochaetales bacterium]
MADKKKKKNSFFSIGGSVNNLFLKAGIGLVLFALIVGAYAYTSWVRHIENPQDRMAPTLEQIVEGIKDTFQAGNTENPTFGDIRIVRDISASLTRLFWGMLISIILSVFIGLYSAAFGFFDRLNMPLIRSFSFIPPIALLPLIFVWLGRYPEAAKIVVIIAGTFFVMVTDVYMRAKHIPKKLIDKGYTLGASTAEVLHKIMLRYCMPGIIESIRLAMTPAWIFLIAAEFSLPSTAGLGYYMNVVRRQLGVNIILWYIFVIVVIGVIVDICLKTLNRLTNKWYFEK